MPFFVYMRSFIGMQYAYTPQIAYTTLYNTKSKPTPFKKKNNEHRVDENENENTKKWIETKSRTVPIRGFTRFAHTEMDDNQPKWIRPA